MNSKNLQALLAMHCCFLQIFPLKVKSEWWKLQRFMPISVTSLGIYSQPLLYITCSFYKISVSIVCVIRKQISHPHWQWKPFNVITLSIIRHYKCVIYYIMNKKFCSCNYKVNSLIPKWSHQATFTWLKNFTLWRHFRKHERHRASRENCLERTKCFRDCFMQERLFVC